jgi:23S rRNA (uracil1939-C5)-methyltransferase
MSDYVITKKNGDSMDNIIEVKVEKLIPGGKGLARVDGKVVFIPFVLPGEVVKIKITEEKKSFSEAELIEVVEASQQRISPECSYYTQCGGCNMQHMTYEAQLKAKSDFVINLLERNGGIFMKEVDIIPSAPYHYRNRVQVHISDEKKGFKERSGNTIINIENCPVVTGGVNRYLAQKESAGSEDRVSVFGKDNWYSVEKDKEEIHITLNEKKIYFDSSLFFQSNISILPQLNDYLNAHVQGKTLLDLYCGVGLFSFMVEDKFKKINAVEINKDVEPYIRKNIQTRMDFYPLSVENWISDKKIDKRANTIIIDPPRTGLTKKVRAFLSRSKAEVIIYVSCDPATMARDLKELTEEKYNIEDLKLFDFYPQTSHMEAVAILKQKS